MNPYAILAAVLFWIASLTVVGVWQRHDGAAVERSAWEGRERGVITSAAKQIGDMQDQARAAEHATAAQLAAISADYQRRLTDAQSQHDADVRAIRAGTLRLRDPGRTAVCSGASGTATASAGAGGRDVGAAADIPGASAGVLSGDAAEFLVGLAGEADAIARQLAACQRVVIEDRARP